jgi:hypothetical protein
MPYLNQKARRLENRPALIAKAKSSTCVLAASNTTFRVSRLSFRVRDIEFGGVHATQANLDSPGGHVFLEYVL